MRLVRAIWQCHSWSTRGPSRSGPAILVLRGGLHLERSDGVLESLAKLTEEELRRFIAGKQIPQGFARIERTQASVPRKRLSSEFRILDHVGKVRRVGRNFVAGCPSCANAGHDRSCDNLSILIGDPRFYRCWAGCTKEMIREALGHPIRVSTARLERAVR